MQKSTLFIRPYPNKETLWIGAAAWEKDQNVSVVNVQWRFTTADARIKLKSLYTKIEI